jgi:hypothetical protein
MQEKLPNAQRDPLSPEKKNRFQGEYDSMLTYVCNSPEVEPTKISYDRPTVYPTLFMTNL